jgi:hypothetical protein
MILRSTFLLLTSTLMITTPFRAEDPERQRLLAQNEKEVAALKKEMDDKVADLVPKQKSLREKIAQREKTLQANTRKGYYTKNSQDALRKLRADLQEVDDQYRERLEPYQSRKEDHEQRRRAVLQKYPEPGDLAFVESQGKLWTRDEWVLEKSRYPGTVAEEYIQELLRRGIIRSARYTKNVTVKRSISCCWGLSSNRSQPQAELSVQRLRSRGYGSSTLDPRTTLEHRSVRGPGRHLGPGRLPGATDRRT